MIAVGLFSGLIFVVVLLRLFVPTVIDRTPTGKVKFLAHVVVFPACVVAYYEWSLFLLVMIVLASLFELWAALFTKGPIL